MTDTTLKYRNSRHELHYEAGVFRWREDGKVSDANRFEAFRHEKEGTIEWEVE